MYRDLHNPRRWILTEGLAEQAARSPDGEWITDYAGRSLRFGQAHRDSLRAAGFFERLGLRRAERAGVFLFNGCPSRSPGSALPTWARPPCC